MKILVTGATGFIGGRLVESLLKKNHDIVCVVRKPSKARCLRAKGVVLEKTDLLESDEVNRAFEAHRPEAVFHCAALVMSKDEKKLLKVNSETTRNVCEACVRYGAGRLVYLSSVAVISGNHEVPLRDNLPYKASNAYGRSKIEAEKIVMSFRDKGLNCAVIRPCIVYGEGEPHAFGRIMTNVDRRWLPVFDIPEMDTKINLVYVGNVVQVLESALEKEEALSGTFMVSDKDILTLREFVYLLYSYAGKGVPPIIPRWIIYFLMRFPFFKIRAHNFLKDRIYNIARAIDLLGYDPECSTYEGLKRSVFYWRSSGKTE
ncbi:MAG: NAD(P)-dependent oxidoreductase [Candidatus Omnitrophota bacterium]